jgi:hypothetical protein
VAARRHSRRRAGECGELTRARALVGKREAISILVLDERRRCVLSTARPSSGGTGEGRLGVRRFRRGGWPRLGWIRLWSKGRRRGSSGPVESEQGGVIEEDSGER